MTPTKKLPKMSPAIPKSTLTAIAMGGPKQLSLSDSVATVPGPKSLPPPAAHSAAQVAAASSDKSPNHVVAPPAKAEPEISSPATLVAALTPVAKPGPKSPLGKKPTKQDSKSSVTDSDTGEPSKDSKSSATDSGTGEPPKDSKSSATDSGTGEPPKDSKPSATDSGTGKPSKTAGKLSAVKAAAHQRKGLR